MRGVLDDAETQYRELIAFSPELIATHTTNAERFQKQFTGSLPLEGEGINSGGNNISIASAVGFAKACMEIAEAHDSLILGAKAILAARLALNTLPKVFSRKTHL